jgi:RHS repeat-associated protein
VGNQRLQMVEAGTQGSTTLYAWAGGSVIAEYDGVGSGMEWTKSYVYLGGRLLATDSTSGIQYHHPDRLGTRLVTNTSGGIVSENIGLPFGNTINGESNNLVGSDSKKRFTSYDRSDNTKLDYAVNRHYSAAQGRFTQVDPIGMSAVSLENPQSLNLYAYCLNDPINHLDPDGLDPEGGGSSGNPIVAIVLAVIGALRVLFGGRRAAAKMGTRLEQRLAQRETGNKWQWAKPSIWAGVGAVSRYMSSDDPPTIRIDENGEAILVISVTGIDPSKFPPGIVPKLPPGLELPPRPPMTAYPGVPDTRIPERPIGEENVKFSKGQTIKATTYAILRIIKEVFYKPSFTAPVFIDPKVYCQFNNYPWCKSDGPYIPII